MLSEKVGSVNENLLRKLLQLQPQKLEVTKSQITLWIDLEKESNYITELYKIDGVLEVSIVKPTPNDLVPIDPTLPLESKIDRE